jgi:dCTP deaminase
MEKLSRGTVKLYLFELTERTSRFYLHLNQINKQFYSTGNSKVEDKLIFVQSYKDCLLNILSIAASIAKQLNSVDNTAESDVLEESMNYIKDLLKSLNDLHQKHLNHLPRPSEPIELRRFSRIIDKHVVKLSSDPNKKKQISIYVNEDIGDSVYIKDPLEEFKTTILDKIFKKYKSSKGVGKLHQFENKKLTDNSIHITIPRIDTNNPCRWPTLIHELGHELVDNKEFFKFDSISADFVGSLSDKQKSFLDEFIKVRGINLQSWLTECWCDLFGCVVFGPAFWFSQYESFIFETGTNDDSRYPQPIFRLKLIHNILTHRFSGALYDELRGTLSEAESVVDYFDCKLANGFNRSNDIREIFMYFREFFRGYFSKVDESENQFGTEFLNSKLSPLIKYTEVIQEATIRELEKHLKLGLPIPSKAIKKNTQTQRPTYVQEVLLAAWSYRNNGLKGIVMAQLLTLSETKKADFPTQFEHNVLESFRKFDLSILRSIQVSEWFDLFYDVKGERELLKLESELNKKFIPLNNPLNQLVDYEIYNLLQSGKLKVIPIMNLKEQLGSTSLDVRLGTSFQLYYQTKYGVVDFSDTDSLQSAENNSNLIDLDYLESITISPGQFILGHTMEYIKLPENIAAEIEGRSSFARLGLEIHMTAGFIDPGFEGVVTLEIYNAGPNPVKLFPGVRIAQLKFIPVNTPMSPYNKKHDAKYKGLLSHHTSMQFKDYEIVKIIEAKNN